MSRKRGETKVRFTPDLWAKWLARFNEPIPELVVGIADMRRELERRTRKRI